MQTNPPMEVESYAALGENQPPINPFWGEAGLPLAEPIPP
jgi:hypothetical protein